jgi:tRNA(Ile)-lysidine synthase
MPTKLHRLEIQIRKTIREFDMLESGERVLVAVSGGADSTALLLCLNRLATELNISIVVAHLNHRIRGEEGDADQDFVSQMSSRMGLPFISEIIEVKKQAIETKENLEQLARRARYGFLRKAASTMNAQKIAVGHTRNDQAETVLLRFLRGSGIQGLSAIHPVLGGLVVRPLLECTRADIIQYLKDQGAIYREDSTNTDLSHTRNRIRQELLPCLEEHYNPQMVRTLSRMAQMARENWSFMESEAKNAFEAIHQKVDGGISMPAAKIAEFHPALQKHVLRFALKACLGSLSGVTSQHIDSLLLLCRKCQSGSQVPMPNRGVVIRQFDHIILLKNKHLSSTEFNCMLNIPGQCFIPEIGAVFTAKLCEMPRELLKGNSTQAFLDPAALPQILTIRSKAPGDRYGGPSHRKVKKMLIDRKIPLAQRLFLPMVVAGNQVIWIPGFSPARGYAAKSGSEMCVILDFTMESRT